MPSSERIEQGLGCRKWVYAGLFRPVKFDYDHQTLNLLRPPPAPLPFPAGNPAGKKGFVTVNLADLQDPAKFAEGEEVTLQSLQEKRVLNVTGKDKKLPLKVLGEGDLPFAMTIHATAFSESAKAAIEAGGGSMVEVPQKAKWTRKAAKAAGKSK